MIVFTACSYVQIVGERDMINYLVSWKYLARKYLVPGTKIAVLGFFCEKVFQSCVIVGNVLKGPCLNPRMKQLYPIQRFRMSHTSGDMTDFLPRGRINYALFEELTAEDMERTRDVYR